MMSTGHAALSKSSTHLLPLHNAEEDGERISRRIGVGKLYNELRMNEG